MVKFILRFTIMLIFGFALSGCNEGTILENLTQEQAVQIQAILQQHDLTATKSGSLKSGYSISVGPTEITPALSLIKEYQLPWSAEVQISQAFPDSSLVSSPVAEKTRVISLEEQRLEQSLHLIDQVINARVHISYPINENDFDGKPEESHVGVIISYKGDLDPNTFIPEIKSLVKNSLNNVDYKNISVVVFPCKNEFYGKLTEQKIPPTVYISYIIIALLALMLLMTSFLYFSKRYNFFSNMRKNVSPSSQGEQEESDENR